MARFAIDSVRRWRNIPVHREVDSRKARWVWKVVLGVAIAVAPLAVYLLQIMSYVQTEYATEDLRAQEARLQEQEQRLSIRRAGLEALPAVEARAGEQLGLLRPPASHVVVVAPGNLARPAPSRAAAPSTTAR